MNSYLEVKEMMEATEDNISCGQSCMTSLHNRIEEEPKESKLASLYELAEDAFNKVDQADDAVRKLQSAFEKLNPVQKYWDLSSMRTYMFQDKIAVVKQRDDAVKVFTQLNSALRSNFDSPAHFEEHIVDNMHDVSFKTHTYKGEE